MAHRYSGLKLVLNNNLINIEDACKTHASFAREALIEALIFCVLDEQTLKRIKLGEAFRRSLQTGRQSAPHRLHSVISACKQGVIDASSLEAKFYNYGGARAVTALAAAAADGNEIMRELESLVDDEREVLMNSIDTIRRHPDLEFMAESMNRKRAAVTSKRTQLVRPRPSRATKQTCRDGLSQKGLHQRRYCAHPTLPSENGVVLEARERSKVLLQGRNQNSQFGTVHLGPVEGQLSAEAAMDLTNSSALDFDPLFVAATGSSSTEGNFGIDLDDINGSYGIDLDRISAL